MQELNLTLASEPSAQAGLPSPLQTGGGKYDVPSVFFPVGLLYTALDPSGQMGAAPSSQRWRLHSARASREATVRKNFILLAVEPKAETDFILPNPGCFIVE